MVAILLYLYLLRAIPGQHSDPPDARLLWPIAAIAVLEAGAALFIRSRKLGTAFEILRNDPADAKALGQWRQAVILSDALAISIVLYGLVLHLISGTDQQAIPFFAAGTVLMVFWWPRRP
jgi:hypothetical protein